MSLDPRLLTLLVLLGSCQSAAAPEAAELEGERPNVLLICIDDLRPELGCYGAEHVRSPALDAFAASALRFDRHYVQFPTCGASRYSFLTGQRPSRPEHYGNGAFESLRGRSAADEPVATLPGVFRAAGYRTVALGKVSHSHDGRARDGESELPGAWDELPTDPGAWREARHLLHGYADGRARELGKSPISEAADVEDGSYPDGILADQAVAKLRELAATEGPFFLAVGFFKPHLPFAAPQRYWDLYDPARLPLSPQPSIPEDLPAVNGWGQSGEVTSNYAGAGFDDGEWSLEERRHLRHGYLACVSFVDAQVGRVLDELDRLGLAEETIVVVWGDHGWHLGDLGLFGKHTTYEASLRSALLVRAPGETTAGTSTRALVEALDVFPTLTELCDLETPAGLPGESFAPLLPRPEASHHDAVLSYWRRGRWLATSVRTDRYRLIGWSDPISRQAGGVELYELEGPGGPFAGGMERENVAVIEGALVDRLIRAHLTR